MGLGCGGESGGCRCWVQAGVQFAEGREKSGSTVKQAAEAATMEVDNASCHYQLWRKS